MKRPITLLSIALAAAVLLSACTITVEPNPPRLPDATVMAGNDDMTPVESFVVPAYRDVFVRINVSSTRPVLYIELDRDIDLVVFNANRTRLASASSRAFFGQGTTGLAAAALLEPQAITTPIACRGSCVILEQGLSSHYYAVISNTSSSPVSVDLFAFGDYMVDDNEPANDDETTAPILNVTTGDSGAIEYLGDLDYWRVTQYGQFAFDAPNGDIGITVTVYNGNEVVDSASHGGSFEVYPGEIVLVKSTMGRAGASFESDYYISPL